MKAELADPLTSAETAKALQQTTSGKAPGGDGLPADIYKRGGMALVEKLTSLYQVIWRKGEVPKVFKDASIVHIYKRKGDRASCDKHPGISLLSIAGKILARIILNRLISHVAENAVPKFQCGFRTGRGTCDMIFAICQLQEKCREENKGLYMVFVDLTKAFDAVNREGLWEDPRQVWLPKEADLSHCFLS